MRLLPVILLLLVGCPNRSAAAFEVVHAHDWRAEGALLETGPELSGPYFGQPTPGPRAEPFALPIPASRPEQYVRAVTFSPGGHEAYWPVIDLEDNYRRWIVVTVMENGSWSPPATAAFSDRKYGDDVPCLAPGGHDLFFLSGRPLQAGGKTGQERIWRMTRQDGTWSTPRPLPAVVNDAYNLHQQVSVDREENLYFGGEGPDGYGSLDICRAQYIDGVYQAPVNLGPAINGPEGEYAPTVSPDGSYLIFTRNQDDGWTLFISFVTPDGAWTPPTDLQAILAGSEGANLSGSFLTADGKHLIFFREQGETSRPYWIDTSFVPALRKKAMGP